MNVYMKRLLSPAILLCVLSLAFIALLDWSNRQLPERVATHFAFNGQPDRWSTRSSAVTLMAGFGLALPLLMVGFAFMSRFLPESSINIPNREVLAGAGKSGWHLRLRVTQNALVGVPARMLYGGSDLAVG
ncbi:MAG: DUF1648 domain-containing protein [Verrucomicrobiia bacterium]